MKCLSKIYKNDHFIFLLVPTKTWKQKFGKSTTKLEIFCSYKDSIFSFKSVLFKQQKDESFTSYSESEKEVKQTKQKAEEVYNHVNESDMKKFRDDIIDTIQ